MILGGDYSLYDQVLDWQNHTWKYAFIKCSEGIIEDPMFKLQWTAAEGYVYRGAYHFFRPLVPWRTAAEKFVQLLEREGKGELPSVLDLEVVNGVSSETVRESALHWLGVVHSRTGTRPIVYTSPGFSETVFLYRDLEFADYLLWQATYPWDMITVDWSEEDRREAIKAVIDGTQRYIFPLAARPWRDAGRAPLWVQWTGKCPPEYVPGYPLGEKKAVDVNFYRHDLDEMKYRFNLPELKGEPPMSSRPITWTAELKAGQTANLRSGAGKTYAIKYPITAPLGRFLLFKGTGVKIHNTVDGYYWGEVLSVDGVPTSGFIAFTTSFDNVTWLETPPPSAGVAITSVVVNYTEDGVPKSKTLLP